MRASNTLQNVSTIATIDYALTSDNVPSSYLQKVERPFIEVNWYVFYSPHDAIVCFAYDCGMRIGIYVARMTILTLNIYLSRGQKVLENWSPVLKMYLNAFELWSDKTLRTLRVGGCKCRRTTNLPLTQVQIMSSQLLKITIMFKVRTFRAVMHVRLVLKVDVIYIFLLACF